MFHPKKFLNKLGPGVVTGASDDDPSGIVTYSQTGAQFGNSFLWLALFTTPLMMAVQEMSARLGLVSGRGLATLIRQHISPKVAVTVSLLLFLANTVNIGADLGALAEVTKLLLPMPAIVALVGYAAIILVLQIRLPYHRYVNILKWLTLSLFTYVITAFIIQIDWGSVAVHALIPSIPDQAGAWMIIVAILGTTISPYLFFWQASEEVEEKSEQKSRGSTASQLRNMRQDTATGMLLSNVVMFFIIVTTAATLHQAGVTTITSAAQAADAIRPLAGSLTFFLFSLGVIGTGMLAIPVLAGSAGYALAEVLQRPEGLSKTFRQAKAFYIVIILAVLVGAGLTLFGIPPVKMLLISAVVNGLLAPVMLWCILRLAERPDIVGQHVSPTPIRWGGWIALVVMSLAVVMLLIEWMGGL